MTESWFQQEEERSQGRLKFIPCPHFAEKGEPYGADMCFINLRDDPQTGAVILALCDQCKSVIIGRLIDEVIDKAIKRLLAIPSAVKIVPDSIGLAYINSDGSVRPKRPDSPWDYSQLPPESADDEDFGHPI